MPRCQCGSTDVATGALRCPVCQAVHERDKKRAKAKIKRISQKGKVRAKNDPIALMVAHGLRDHIASTLEARFEEV